MSEDLPPLIHLSYPLDTGRLMQDAEEARKIATGFNEKRAHQTHREPQDYFRIGRYTSDYIKQIMEDLGVNGNPRFYFQDPGSYLDWHTDINTLCSINMILSEEPAPISFRTGDVFYKQALLNTTVSHAVKNGEKERILFKISIFDETYEQVASKIKYRLS